MEKQEWTVKQAERAYLEESLPMCNGDSERAMLKAIHGPWIRKLADHWKAQGKLTPGDIAIAEKYGWKG